MVCKTLTVKPKGILPEPIPWEWVAGIGLGALAIGGAAYYMVKKKRRK